jgi:hypothetical protein
MTKSSFPKVADQIISFNKNLVDILSKLNSLVTTNNSSVDVQITDEEGILRSFTLPSFTSLKAEIDRLNNNINSIYGLDSSGAVIQTTGSNSFRKIVTVNLNREPRNIESLGIVTNFKSKLNWFFDSLIDPMLQVEIDLTGKIENDIKKCLVRRYIVDFARDSSGQLTTLGSSALNSFNQLFRGNANIIFTDFIKWHNTTPGLVDPSNPLYDEENFYLEPNEILFDGTFNVIRIEEDRLNRKLWYHLNSLTYIVSSNSEPRELAIGDELLVNINNPSTRYKILEISKSQSNPRVRLERVEGIQPIPIGIASLKIYSPILFTKRVRISIGYNERNVIFIKPINTETNIIAKNWSLGTGFYSNDLRIESDTSENGLSMEEFYTDYVLDYGISLKDMVSKKIPNTLAGTPNPPELIPDNFKVVQINKHLTDTPNSNLIKQKHNQQLTLRSEVKQLEDALIDRERSIRVDEFKTESDRKQFNLEIEEISRKKESKSKILASIAQEIIDISKSPLTKIEPKFRLRGFWQMPEPVFSRGSLPQEIIQFRIQYRYVSIDGRQSQIEQFSLSREEDEQASFSNWVEFKTDVRKRVFNKDTGEYFWQIEDVEDADTPNINQLDIPIQSGERIEFRVKSISEVGWPESPVESDWSRILNISFPEDLNNVINENDFILKDADKEDLLNSLNSDLESRGINQHLSDTIIVNNKTYYHDVTSISSGVRDENGVLLSLAEYLQSLQNKIRSLEELISRTRGVLKVYILRNNREFVVENDSETIFNIECEDYLTNFSGPGIPTGRVYENSVYVVKDFAIRVENIAQTSPLGLLSNRNYLQNNVAYNQNAPQVFWVNNQDDLLKSDITAQTRTQLNNQFIWAVNFESLTQNSVTRLSENIGNSFIEDNTNSITSILSTPQYNIGYGETSILSFIGNNTSLLDPQKWIDIEPSAASTNKLLTTIHPVVRDLEKIVENNTDKIKSIKPGENNAITIPINIYFKLNAMDTNQTGLNFQYIDMNNSTETQQHVKKIKFMLEDVSDNRPFVFSIRFNINRNKIIQGKIQASGNSTI